MSETNQNQTRNCKSCGKEVIDTGTGGVVHAGGGMVEQKCQNCGWMGGQYGGFKQCVRCGDMVSLINDHSAS